MSDLVQKFVRDSRQARDVNEKGLSAGSSSQRTLGRSRLIHAPHKNTYTYLYNSKISTARCMQIVRYQPKMPSVMRPSTPVLFFSVGGAEAVGAGDFGTPEPVPNSSEAAFNGELVDGPEEVEDLKRIDGSLITDIGRPNAGYAEELLGSMRPLSLVLEVEAVPVWPLLLFALSAAE